MTPEDQWDAEREAHIAMRAELNRQQGLDAAEARQAAEKAFGNQTQIGEQVRAVRVPECLDQLRQDLQYAWRGLRRSPGFTITAAAAIAIGIRASKPSLASRTASSFARSLMPTNRNWCGSA